MSWRVARGFGLAALLVSMGFGPPPAAGQASLTLENAQEQAVTRSRALEAKDSAALAARDMALAAGQLPDPTAKLELANLPVTGEERFSATRDFMTMRSVGVMQEFTRADKRRARAERFERDAEKATAQRVLLAANIQRDTAMAWVDRYYTEAMLAVLAEQSREAQAEIDAADAAYRAARGSLPDVLAVRTALSLLNDRTSDLQRRLRASKIALSRWVGDAAELPLAGKPAIDAISLDSRTLDLDIAHHPDLAVLAKQEEIAAAEVKVAEANKKADWSVQLMYSQRGPSYSNMVSVGVSVPLQWDQKNRQDREIAAKLAMLDQARAEREDMARAHVAELRGMIVEWETTGERLARYQREVLPLATERTGAVMAAYRAGKSTMADVLAARRNEIDVRMQAVQLEMERARLWAQLNFIAPTDHRSHAARAE